MKNYKRKIAYTIFTFPFFYATVNAYFWQTRRKLEKIDELELRRKRIKENLYKIDPYEKYVSENELFPWINMDETEFRNNWEYKGIDIKGIFDYNNKVLISTTRSSESGYNIILPFYCYNLENKGPFPILVDRGWIAKDWIKKYDEECEGNLNKVEEIKGMLYKGDKNNKFSKENDLVNKKFFTTRPDELAKYFDLPNQQITSKFIIKELSTFDDKKMYPEKVTMNDIMFTQITPKKHQDYAYFWAFVSVLNFSTNIYVWLL